MFLRPYQVSIRSVVPAKSYVDDVAVAQSEDENRDILFHTGNSNNSLGLVLTEKKVAVIHKSQEKIPVLLLSTP